MSEKIREIQALTYTAQFDMVEDRIKLSINYENIENRCDFWITRRLFLKIVPTVEQFLYDKAPQCFDQVAASKKGGTSTDSSAPSSTPQEYKKTDTSLLALTQTDPHLLMNMEMTLKENGLILLTLSSDELKAIGFVEPKHLWDIVKMIFSTIPLVEWGLSPHLISQG